MGNSHSLLTGPEMTYLLTALALAAAIPATVDRYTGTWDLVREESDSITPVIEAVVAKMSFVVRPIARGRLAKTQVAFPSISITREGQGIRIRHTGGTDVAHSDTTAPIEAKAPDGSVITVRLDAGPPLVQSYQSGEGVRKNTYTLNSDSSRMTLDVLVTSPRLPKPIAYKLVYRRH